MYEVITEDSYDCNLVCVCACARAGFALKVRKPSAAERCWRGTFS